MLHSDVIGRGVQLDEGVIKDIGAAAAEVHPELKAQLEQILRPREGQTS